MKLLLLYCTCVSVLVFACLVVVAVLVVSKIGEGVVQRVVLLSRAEFGGRQRAQHGLERRVGTNEHERGLDPGAVAAAARRAETRQRLQPTVGPRALELAHRPLPHKQRSSA